LIESGSKETDTVKYAKLIRNSVKRLEGFIRNILSYSKNNRLELSITEIPIQQTVEEIIDLLRNSKEAEGITFSIKLDERKHFYSDVQRLTIILENLISNAIKFQDHKRHERTISVTGDVDEERLAITVTDNGIGIPENFRSKIFDMFFRISGEREGSGIGLYIVKETVTKLEGTISVNSSEHAGTSFNVQLKNFAPRFARVTP
jgi:signal transduction histidine kinase